MTDYLFDNLLDLCDSTASNRKTTFYTDEGKVHDRSTTVGSSEVFGCIKQVSYAKHKTPEDEGFVQNWGFLERGNKMEEWVVALVKEAIQGHGRLLSAGSGQSTLQWQYLSATPDGYLKYATAKQRHAGDLVGEKKEKEVCFEIKSIDPRYQGELPKSQHVNQTQVQMGLSNLLHEDKDISEAWIIYVDASDYSKMSLHKVEFDKAIFTNAINRANDAMTTEPELLAAEGKFGGECRYCPYVKRCGEHIIDAMPTGNGMTNHQQDFVTPLIEEKVATDKEIKDLKRKQGALTEDIKTFMRKEGIKSGKSDDYLITYGEVQGRRTLDKGKVAEQGIDLSDCYSIGNPTDQLKIKEIK